jgi:hypothetical protein
MHPAAYEDIQLGKRFSRRNHFFIKYVALHVSAFNILNQERQNIHNIKRNFWANARTTYKIKIK